MQSFALFVVAALIGIDEFGRFAFMFGGAQVMTVFFEAGSPLLLLRVLPARDVAAGGWGSAALVIRCLLRTLVLALASLVLATALLVWGNAEIGRELLLAALTGFLLSVLHNLIAVVRVAKSAIFSMLLNDVFPHLGFFLVLIVFIALGGQSAEWLILIYCFAVLVAVILSIISCKTYLVDRGPYWCDAGVGEVFRISHFWGGALSGAALSQLDIMLARVLLDEGMLGIYALLRRTSNFVSMPQVIANWTINQQVAREFQRRDISALQELANRGLALAVPVSLSLLVLIATFSVCWLPLFNVEPDRTVVSLLIILLFAQAVNVLFGANALFATQCDQEAYLFQLRLLTLALSAAVMVLAGWLFGAMGLALTVLFAMGIMNAALSYRVRCEVGVWTTVRILII
ncbi:hypothetical protein G3480_23805 [Thiorhodococcus mannitoliphagus]|uniref:Oligosaccharide flippase family protein n=1 Tax=Thiorhodococcus mannitoliphagus TaxID=329406 RepID=A0A6P1E5I4_9GAMM|nr:hypothetical protein [Thiorhodococcus mannitoliphagus]NEX23284.1 hypothetical protein [Thiorhodococcus mannitoliphagus]